MTISGVQIKSLPVIPDERGYLMEIMRCDERIFKNFGQIYLTTVYPNVVKAWHRHEIQTDFIVCIKGMLKLVLYDNRKGDLSEEDTPSPTFGEIQEYFIGDHNPLLVKIPPNIYHGFQAVGNETAYVVCIPTEPYNYVDPDEYRIPPDTKLIPYNWDLMPGLKHG